MASTRATTQLSVHTMGHRLLDAADKPDDSFVELWTSRTVGRRHLLCPRHVVCQVGGAETCTAAHCNELEASLVRRHQACM